MQNLTRAHDELFRRTPDETFPTLQALWEHCQRREGAVHRPLAPAAGLRPVADGGRLDARPRRGQRTVPPERLELHPALRPAPG